MGNYDYYAVLVQTSDGTRCWCGVRDLESIDEQRLRRQALAEIGFPHSRSR